MSVGLHGVILSLNEARRDEDWLQSEGCGDKIMWEILFAGMEINWYTMSHNELKGGSVL
jgi:hypothetical protein